MKDSHRSLVHTCAALLFVWCNVCAAADSFPTRPVRIIVPTAPGGNLDLTSRTIAMRMSDTLGQSVVVENRSGNTIVGTQAAAKAPADGYTLLSISNAFVISALLLPNAGYDAVKDFTGIGLMNEVPFMLIVNPSVPAKTVQELITIARDRPTELSYASAGSGTTTHIVTVLFFNHAGVKVLHVPYKGNAPAMPDIMAGRVSMMFDPINTSTQLVREGKLRALAVTSKARSPLFPDVPTIGESGLPGFEFSVYTELVAPAGTPREAIVRLHASLAKATTAADLRELMMKEGRVLRSSDSPEQLNEFIRSEVVRYAKVIKDSGIQP